MVNPIKTWLHQRYFDFERDLKFSLSRFKVEREIERALNPS